MVAIPLNALRFRDGKVESARMENVLQRHATTTTAFATIPVIRENRTHIPAASKALPVKPAALNSTVPMEVVKKFHKPPVLSQHDHVIQKNIRV